MTSLPASFSPFPLPPPPHAHTLIPARLQLKLLPNPFEDPKIRKVLAKEDRVEMVKELFKLLAKQAGGGKKK